jgi:Holliday junction DNA helicase RuvB
MIKRVRDFAQINNHKTIDSVIARKALEMMEVDELGLEPTDRHILETIIKKFNGGPVGIQTIAAATSEEVETIEDVYEPFLIQLGFLTRTPRGRMVTEHGYAHLGYPAPRDNQKRLLIYNLLLKFFLFQVNVV